MKKLLLSVLFTSILFVIPSVFPLATFADTYGSGNFGGGVYNANSSNSNPVSSAISSVGSTIATFFCTNQAPSSAPNLYEIDVTSTTATVYFSPSAGPDDNYFISYGQGNNSEGNGLQLNTGQSSGAIFYKIQSLAPNTVYTFKVRGGNGCKPGPWSNTLTIQTRVNNSRILAKFYPAHQAQYVQAPAPSLLTQTSNFISNLFPGAPNTGHAPDTQHKNSFVLGASTKSAPRTSLWNKIVNFFTGIFH